MYAREVHHIIRTWGDSGLIKQKPNFHQVDDPIEKQGKSEGFDSCDQPSNFAYIGFKSIFWSMWSWNLLDNLEKQ